jgi:hypothetical protein
LAGATGSTLAATTWDNGGGDYAWNNALNWNPDGVPDSTTEVAITTGTSAAQPANITATASAAQIDAPGTGQSMYLAIGADLAVGGTFGVHAKGTGVVTQTAGTVTPGTLSLSSSTTSAGTGSYTLTGTGSVQATTLTANGGTGSIFTQNGSGTTVQFGNVASGNNSGGDRWTYNLMAGTFTTTGSIDRTYGGWFFNQTGGAATIGTALNLGTGYRAAVPAAPMEWSIKGNSSLSVAGNVTMGWVGDGGTHTGAGVEGQFTLNGSKGSGSDVTVGGNWRQAGSLTPNTATDSWGRLQGIIDAAAITTPSDMRKIIVTGDVTFDDASYLLPEFDPLATPTPGSWTLMTWSGALTDNGLMFDPSVDSSAGDGVGWSFNLDSTNKSLIVTYSAAAVPEPASLGLLGVGAVALLRRRRQSQR